MNSRQFFEGSEFLKKRERLEPGKKGMSVYARPHPGPLPRGEGETLSRVGKLGCRVISSSLRSSMNSRQFFEGSEFLKKRERLGYFRQRCIEPPYVGCYHFYDLPVGTNSALSQLSV
jgi:hypothetical protein